MVHHSEAAQRSQVSTRVRVILVLAGIVLTAITAALLTIVVQEPTLDAWIAKVQQADYQLLLKRESSSHYIAVFDAGGSQMAICARDRRSREGAGQGFVVYDLEGRDLIVFDLPERHDELRHEIRTPFLSYRFSNHGVMYPIDPDHTGPVRVVITEESTALLDEVVPWPAPALSVKSP